MMALGSAFQTNGLGSRLCASTKRLMAVCSATREWKTPRWRRRLVSLAKKVSTGCCQSNANWSPKRPKQEISGRQLTPLSQGGGAVLFEDGAAGEVAIETEMVVNRGVTRAANFAERRAGVELAAVRAVT